MSTHKKVRILVCINFSLILLLLTDSFVLPPKEMQDVYDHATYANTAAEKGAYTRYSIVGVSGKSYDIPYHSGIVLDDSSVFVIKQSSILRLPLYITYQSEGRYYGGSISILTGNYIVILVIVLVIGFSIFSILPRRIPERVIGRLTGLSIFFYAGFLLMLFL